MSRTRLKSLFIAATVGVAVVVGAADVWALEPMSDGKHMDGAGSSSSGMTQDGMMEQESDRMMDEGTMEGQMGDDGMMGMEGEMSASEEMMDDQLDALVAMMEAARGKKKTDAIAAVVKELVKLHKSMHSMPMDDSMEGMSQSGGGTR